jgi:hypothetical protein
MPSRVLLSIPIAKSIIRTYRPASYQENQLLTMDASLESLKLATPTPTSSTPARDPPRSRFASESAMALLVDSLQDRLLFAIPKKGAWVVSWRKGIV